LSRGIAKEFDSTLEIMQSAKNKDFAASPQLITERLHGQFMAGRRFWVGRPKQQHACVPQSPLYGTVHRAIPAAPFPVV
jgi:hypothetical protein